jgi:hypothetical protein
MIKDPVERMHCIIKRRLRVVLQLIKIGINFFILKHISLASTDKHALWCKLIDLYRWLFNGKLYYENNVGMHTYASQTDASVIDYNLKQNFKHHSFLSF